MVTSASRLCCQRASRCLRHSAQPVPTLHISRAWTQWHARPAAVSAAPQDSGHATCAARRDVDGSRADIKPACSGHETRAHSTGPSTFAVTAACSLGLWQLWLAEAVLAEDGMASPAYNPVQGQQLFENIAGIAYIVLVGFFLFKVFSRRAKRAREQRIAGTPEDAQMEPSVFEQLRVRLNQNIDPNRQTGPLDAFLGAAQAGLLAAGLYLFSTKLQGKLDATELPDAYTARNISLTVRTILSGLSWLATFIFAANSVGLLGLTVQWLLFPDSIKEDEEELARRRAAQEAGGPQLPKIGVASKPQELLRAFEQAERLGKLESLSSLSSTDTTTSVSSGTSTSMSSFDGSVEGSHSKAGGVPGGVSSLGASPKVVTERVVVAEFVEPVYEPEPIKASPFSKQEVIEGAADLSERMR